VRARTGAARRPGTRVTCAPGGGNGIVAVASSRRRDSSLCSWMRRGRVHAEAGGSIARDGGLLLCGSGGGWPAGRRTRRLRAASEERQNEQGSDGHGQERPSWARPQALCREPWDREPALRRAPSCTGARGPDRRRRRRAPLGWGCLERVVEGRRILAPECIRGRRQALIAEGLHRTCGAANRNQFLTRPEPITREPHDIRLVPSLPADLFGLAIARFHGFADLSSPPVGVSVSLDE
jgi:hypothetical protein